MNIYVKQRRATLIREQNNSWKLKNLQWLQKLQGITNVFELEKKRK